MTGVCCRRSVCVTELRVQWVLQGQVSGQLGTWQEVRRPGRSWSLCGHGSGRARGLERRWTSSRVFQFSWSWVEVLAQVTAILPFQYHPVLIPQSSPDTEITSFPWLPLWVLCVSCFYVEKQNRTTLTTCSTQYLLDNCKMEAKELLTLFPINNQFSHL